MDLSITLNQMVISKLYVSGKNGGQGRGLVAPKIVSTINKS